MILLTRKKQESVLIGSLETIGCVIRVTYLRTESGDQAKLGFEVVESNLGGLPRILRQELTKIGRDNESTD